MLNLALDSNFFLSLSISLPISGHKGSAGLGSAIRQAIPNITLYIVIEGCHMYFLGSRMSRQIVAPVVFIEVVAIFG